MPSEDYWKARMEAVEDMIHTRGIEYTAYIDKQFGLAERAIQRKIDYWYNKLADNNEITLEAAKRLLREDELEDFHLSVEEYIEKGKTLNYHNTWQKQLENASAKVHISRLEAMKLQMQQECEVLYGNLTDGLDDTLRDMYTEGYYHTAYEIQKGLNLGWSFNLLDANRIEKAVNTIWTNDGKNFTARCWINKQKLINELNTVLTQNIIRGESPQRAIEQLSKRMKVSRHNAGRLIMTESSFIYSQSQKDCFKELDVERYEFVATLDSSTSETCRRMDGRVLKMSEYEIGVTAPPLHCFCRSVTVPYFEDEVGERAARGEDGKTYRVPGNMTYKEWKKSFVDGDVSDLERVRENVQKMKPVNKNGEEIQFDERLESDERWNDSLDVIKNMSNEYDTKLTLVRPYEKGENRTHAAGDVSPLGEMRLSSNKQSTAFHEFAHSLATTNDKKYGLDSQEDFWKEIRKIRTEYKKACRENYRFRISLNAEDDLDEFMAEAFTQAKMKQIGLELDDIYGDDFTYSNKVLAVVDKYFKKEAVENVAERGIIKASTSTIADAKRLPNATERSRVINEAINAKEPVYADDLRVAYRNVKAEDGLMDVCLHGEVHYTEYEGKYKLDTETLAYIVSGRREYQGNNIRLLSCSTGKVDKNGNCVAQELADLLGVDVYAPIDTLYIKPNGELRVGKKELTQDEGFRWFSSRKGGAK